jgi:sialate O-acetylesterase
MRAPGRASVALILPVLLTGVLAARQPPQPNQAPQLLHLLFQDHSVLQRDRPITVYGETVPGAAVAVTLGTATAQARADANGQWRARLPPLGAYTFRGAVWYQGESDVHFSGSYYKSTLLGMMAERRRQFADPNLPFLLVQLPSYGAMPTQPAVSTWASLREAQRQTAAADPHAALAVTLDLGDPADLHPTNKQEVGRRLSVAARHLIYGERIPPSGPVAAGVRRRGADVVVSFRDVTGALTMRHDGRGGFELCADTPGSCRWADARVQGRSVRLSNAAGATRVRYAWGGSPACPLADASGLPAGPFEIAIR